MGETVLNSTHYSMLENDREQLEQILANISRRQNVLALRLIDARGRVRYSKDPEEIGRSSDLASPLCQGCHHGGSGRMPSNLKGGIQLYSSQRGAWDWASLRSPRNAPMPPAMSTPDQRVLASDPSLGSTSKSPWTRRAR
jgi:hypothetical protein